MATNTQIIELYSTLADKPETDFGWDKGLSNAKAHNYKEEWFTKLPESIWQYCAAVGNPFSLGEIKKGSTIVDFGCGAGVDLLIGAQLVGENGKAIGIDITPKMVEKAISHAKLAGLTNVEVYESDFENTPLEDESVDYVISNGAINLTSCKQAVFAEIHRILKTDGVIYFADMIDVSEPSTCCNEEESSCEQTSENDWANCVAGTLRKDELIEIIQKAGFSDVTCTGVNHYKTAQTTQGATFTAKKIPNHKFREQHWDALYKRVDPTKVFWHQASPSKSLEFITKHTNIDDAIIDVGCGISFLADNLLANGYKDITLLDTAKTSLETVKKRLNEQVCFICDDILNFQTTKKFQLWHDRAVFHFLQTNKERMKYFEVLNNSLEKNGVAIISTFRTEGDLQCAGLDVVQYDYEKMNAELPSTLQLITSEDYLHTTPKDTQQKYIYFVIQKVSN